MKRSIVHSTLDNNHKSHHGLAQIFFLFLNTTIDGDGTHATPEAPADTTGHDTHATPEAPAVPPGHNTHATPEAPADTTGGGHVEGSQ